MVLILLSTNTMIQAVPGLYGQVSLIDVLDEIGEEFKVVFTYDVNTLADIEVESQYIESDDFSQVLTTVLKPTGLAYKHIGERYYIIFKDNKSGKRKAKRLRKDLQKLNVTVQDNVNSEDQIAVQSDFKSIPLTDAVDRGVSGLVMDESGEPLIGATVLVKGTTVGTATDLDGKFVLSVPDDASILVVSYTGFSSQEIDITDRDVVEIILSSGSETLEEVVVVGYGTSAK